MGLDDHAGDVVFVESARNCACRVGDVRICDRDGPRFFYIPCGILVAIRCYQFREFFFCQFVAFLHGIGFAEEGFVFGFFSIDAGSFDDVDFVEVLRQGVLIVRVDFVSALDEFGDADLTVGDCRCRGVIPVPEGVVVAVLGCRQGDFCPFAVFFDEGGDDGLVFYFAQAQFPCVLRADFEGDVDVVISVDFFSVIICRRDIGVVRFGRILFVLRDVGNDVFVAVFASVFCRIFSRRNVCVICRHVGRPFFKYQSGILSSASLRQSRYRFKGGNCFLQLRVVVLEAFFDVDDFFLFTQVIEFARFSAWNFICLKGESHITVGDVGILPVIAAIGHENIGSIHEGNRRRFFWIFLG